MSAYGIDGDSMHKAAMEVGAHRSVVLVPVMQPDRLGSKRVVQANG